MKKYAIIFILLLYLASQIPVAAFGTSSSEGCHSLDAEHMLADGQKYDGSATAAILYERNTQTLVFAHHPDKSINPTGLVKLLTALIVLEEGNLDDVVTVKRSTLNSVGVGAVSAGLKAGEEISLRDLLYCVMISSANDAAAVMAEHVAGSQEAFVQKMNARAATLGCGNTRFTNVHGLKDERQYSTARDLAIILDEALKNQQFAMYFGINSQILAATNMSQSRKLTTTNYMMDPSSKYYDSRVTGGKPAAATSSDRSMACVAKDGDCEYLVVVISAKAKMSGNAITRYTNFDEASSLLDMGFEGYSIQQVLGTEQPYSMYPVSGGKNHVVVGPDTDVYALLPIEFDNNLLRLQDTRREEALIAPLQKGTVVGSLQIYYDSIYIGQVDVLARHDVELLDADIADDPVDDVTNQNRFAPVLKWMISILVGAVVSVIAGWLILRRKKRIQKSKAKNNAIERRERGTV